MKTVDVGLGKRSEAGAPAAPTEKANARTDASASEANLAVCLIETPPASVSSIKRRE
jgi:hypothetical protein